MVDWNEFRQMRWEAILDGMLLLGRGFVDAASAHPWMWAVLILGALTASRRAWWRLVRFIGLAALRGERG